MAATASLLLLGVLSLGLRGTATSTRCTRRAASRALALHGTMRARMRPCTSRGSGALLPRSKCSTPLSVRVVRSFEWHARIVLVPPLGAVHNVEHPPPSILQMPRRKSRTKPSRRSKSPPRSGSRRSRPSNVLRRRTYKGTERHRSKSGRRKSPPRRRQSLVGLKRCSRRVVLGLCG